MKMELIEGSETSAISIWRRRITQKKTYYLSFFVDWTVTSASSIQSMPTNLFL